MIIIRIQGGLGNQLFQYAAARNLAEQEGAELKLDLLSFHSGQVRNLELSAFNFEPLQASLKEIKQFSRFPQLYRHNPVLFSKLGRHIYREPFYHFDSNFLNLKDPVYLDGFFQSEKYFKAIEDIIRKEFIVKAELVKHLTEIINQWKDKETVSVHIRRGDYTQKKYLAYHGLLTAEYFNQSIKIISEKINHPHFCFFSDDINWVKKNINITASHTFISDFTKTAIEDFYLMSQCKHNIIANSSFSWWAAWLNNNPKKNIIAPQKWFNEAPHNTKDLIPNGWICL